MRACVRKASDAHGVALDSGHATGIALILLDARKQNHIVAIYGANMQCGDEQVRAAELALDGARALLLQLEIPFEVSLQVARTAMSRGVRVIWGPGAGRGLPARSLRRR